MNEIHRKNRAVGIWLLIGVLMVFVQIIIGGITRLTNSGLSITEWNIIKGTLPPLSHEAWIKAFELYKTAAKQQYEALHADMTLSEFKFIYFWEYFHRLWARSMGFVFLFPFLYFWWTGKINRFLIKRLGLVVFLAALAASVGWIMVASGLNEENRTWVSAYKLMIHLSVGVAVYAATFWTALHALFPRKEVVVSEVQYKKYSLWISALIFVQIALGALMAGMRAGLVHPYYPIFINGGNFWHLLTDFSSLNTESWLDYEKSVVVKAWVQVFHRGTALILMLLILDWYRKSKTIVINKKVENKWITANFLLITMLIIQILLGVITIIQSKTAIPPVWGVLHQAGAILLLSANLWVNHHFYKNE